MKFYRILLLIGVLYFSFNNVQAQSFSEDVAKMLMYFEQLNNFELKVDVESFTAINDKQAASELNMVFVIQDDRYFMDYGLVKVIGTSESLLTIKDDSKLIVYAPIYHNPNNESKEGASEQLDLAAAVAEIDSLQEQCERITFKGVKAGLKIYELAYKQGLVERLTIHMDQKTGALRKTIYEYDSSKYEGDQRVETTYWIKEDFDLLPAEQFSACSYLDIQSDKITGIGKYEDYNVFVNDSSRK